MTDKKQPEAPAFCWATELSMTQQPVTLSVTEAREVSAEMQRLHAENTALQQSYAAARLEIESLQSRIKTMSEEHADELTVAHLDGRMRVAQPAGAQQPTTKPAPQQEAASVDLKTMELAESVGLIGPASRTNDLHAAIQRFHDLICANATIKAAAMAVEVVSGVSAHQWDTGYPPLPDFDTVEQHIYGACRRYITQDMLEPIHNLIRETVDADRAARAPADSVLEDAARLTYEQAHAIRQGHEISASDGYFEARPQIDSNDRRKVFQAGFERGWDVARKQGGA